MVEAGATRLGTSSGVEIVAHECTCGGECNCEHDCHCSKEEK